MTYKGKGINGWCKALAGSGYMVEAGKGSTVKVLNEDGLYLFSRRSLKSAVEAIHENIRLEYDPIDNPRNRATILAALRHYQFVQTNRYDFRDIATDGGKFEALTDSEIDVLCETINCK